MKLITRNILDRFFLIACFCLLMYLNIDFNQNSNSLCTIEVDSEKASALVDACYDSSEFNDEGFYTIIYGEECYDNNGIACGKNQGCEHGTGTEEYCYEYVC